MTLDVEMRDLTPIELDQASGGLDPFSMLVGSAISLAMVLGLAYGESSGWMNEASKSVK
jgi:hypothetical protein